MRKRIYLISIMWVRCILLSWFINEVGIVWIFGKRNLCLWRMTQVGKKLSSPPLTNLILKLWSLHIVVYVESLYRRLRCVHSTERGLKSMRYCSAFRKFTGY